MTAVDEPLDNGIFETYTLKVGQADARFTITENGQTILFDADEDEVVDSLNTILEGRDVERNADGTISIDTFAVTHIDQDHVGGLGPLRQNGYTIQNVVEPDNDRFDTYIPGEEEPDGRVSKFVLGMYESELDAHDIDSISQVSEGEKIPIDSDTDLHVLSPPATDESVDVVRVSTGYEVELPSKRTSENGAVYKLDGERSASFMGDVQDKSDHYGESWLMQQHDKGEIDLSADVLFVAHHGSDNATSEEFLERVEPEIAVISSDFAEDHGHPHDAVLKNLHEHDVGVYWTAAHGTTNLDLEESLSTEQTNDLETTNPADLAALKYHCKETGIDPEEIDLLRPDDLPEETPEWVADAASLVETPEETVDRAITNTETVEELRETLDEHHDATDHLREVVQIDHNEHVTTPMTVIENGQAYRDAKQGQAAAQPSRLDRVRSALPFISDPDLPEYDGPAPEEIEGPFSQDAVPEAVSDSDTAAGIRDGITSEPPPDYLVAAEQQANRAVDTAETAGELC